MTSHSSEFIEFALNSHVLSFGEFKTKAGRISPYFFNAGDFNDGAKLGALGKFYARALMDSAISFDMLFGPAYKGISLAASTVVALSDLGKNVPFAYNRKEAKDHGEGGVLVGAKLSGNVVIIDDVISAGTSVRESVELIQKAGAKPCAVLIALDRMEKSGTATEIGPKNFDKKNGPKKIDQKILTKKKCTKKNGPKKMYQKKCISKKCRTASKTSSLRRI